MSNPLMENRFNITRRHFLGKLSLGRRSVALGSLLMPDLFGGKEVMGESSPSGLHSFCPQS